MKNNLKSTGAIGDPRTPTQKQKDFKHEEVSTSTPVEWVKKDEWKNFPVKRQTYTLECVAYSTTKHLAINNISDFGGYVDLDPDFFYWYRVNKPGGGMMWDDAMKIAIKKGASKSGTRTPRTRETDPEIEPTQKEIEDALNAIGKSFVSLEHITLDSIAQIIQERGSCLMWFWFDKDGKEWWKVVPSIKYKNLGTYDNDATRHAVIGTDFGIRKGDKVIKIEDSAGNNTAEDDQNRFITEDMLKRCFIAGYVIDFKYEPSPIPVHIFNKNLKYGETSEDIKKLQDIYKSLGLFPSNVKSTGYFGGLTATANEKFQIKSGISPTSRNDVGPKTRKALNALG